MARGVTVSGWGRHLPEGVLTNADWVSRLDTTEEWIVERTGIKSRHVGGTTVSNAIEAARAALASAGRDPAELGLIVVATTTPDRLIPPAATEVAEALGVTCGTFDMGATCAGFIYGLAAAAGISAQTGQPALVIGSDTTTRLGDPADRSTAVLFGDAAGAFVLEPVDGPGDLLGWVLGSEPCREILNCETGGYLFMRGQDVFFRAVHMAEQSVHAALKEADVAIEDVDILVPHQANTRIMEAVARRVGVPLDRLLSVIDHTGNISSASIPVALSEAADDGRVRAGSIVLMTAFGGGMTGASAVLRWGR